ncbi:MAG TPA: TRAP transporter substrate-binding protein DctP [Polyangiales bacterium]|nr:TRAP transporter substrate-binding protein DctP [Polyangiales bacterium]
MTLTLSGPEVATAAETQYLKVATLAPRDSDLAKAFLKLDKQLKGATNGGWGVKLFAGGTQGDEVDVIKKIKEGQLDASLITSVGLSQIVRDTTLLTTPGVISTYKQLEAVQAALSKEWEAQFEKAGYKLLGWGETGQLRWFAKAPLTAPSAVAKMRPWVWPASHSQKETLRAAGGNGVPLGVPEVFGALSTGMIDMVISTCVAMVSLQWHANLKYMTKNTTGVLVGALLMGGQRWKSMPADVQQLVTNEVNKNRAEDKVEIRAADERSYQAMLKRGYTANEWTGAALAEYQKVAETVQKRLVGRMYTQAQLDKVKALVAAAK